DLCRAEGLRHDDAHTALADADAAGRLLAVYLKRADAAGARTAAELGIGPLVLSAPVNIPTAPPDVRIRTSPAPARHALPGVATGDPRLDTYLDMLEVALADHVITQDEEQRLAALATASGLSTQQVASVRHAYLMATP
uniref:hypothetical protein n=1 Tax=Pseudonocardia pini TaxID=2758030 RepID=UPI001C68C743